VKQKIYYERGEKDYGRKERRIMGERKKEKRQMIDKKMTEII